MIMIEGWVRLDAAEIESLRDGAAAMARASRAEDGCEEFAFSQDLADPSLFRIVERWRDEATLGAHLTTPHMAAFQQAMGGAVRRGGSVKMYKATFERALLEE